MRTDVLTERACAVPEITSSGQLVGDPRPRLGTAGEKDERLTKLIARHRTLLVLDGLEPLQNPAWSARRTGYASLLQALLRELAAFNTVGFA